MEVMDMGGPWVSLGCGSPWALRNWQLRWMGRQRSCEEILMQKGLWVAIRGTEEIQSLSVPRIIQLTQQNLPMCLCLEHCPNS